MLYSPSLFIVQGKSIDHGTDKIQETVDQGVRPNQFVETPFPSVGEERHECLYLCNVNVFC